MRVIGIDLGERRIGLAVSDASATLARPLRTLQRGDSDEQTVTKLLAEIEQLTQDDGLACIVMGLPLRLDGTPTEQTPRVRQLADALAARTTVPIVFQDERLTSREAEQRLAISERDWRKRKAKLDAAAAAIILQDYLDNKRKRGATG